MPQIWPWVAKGTYCLVPKTSPLREPNFSLLQSEEIVAELVYRFLIPPRKCKMAIKERKVRGRPRENTSTPLHQIIHRDHHRSLCTM
uniref:Uncharacterized protein n=1 Tax=Sphaerodactylus townsendi TaxID=933632 RepID=A0ACB8ETB1_9SAUR